MTLKLNESEPTSTVRDQRVNALVATMWNSLASSQLPFNRYEFAVAVNVLQYQITLALAKGDEQLRNWTLDYLEDPNGPQT